MPEMNTYEKSANADLTRWKNPQQHMLIAFFDRLSRPLDVPFGWLMKSPLGDAANQVLTAVLGAINHGAVQTVDAEAICAKFRANGHPLVVQLADLFTLDLESVDQVVGALHLPYMAIGFAEGTATGLGGGIGLAADIPLILALNLRAIADYASHYGLDARSEAERIYALRVLDFALSPTQEAKRAALTQLAALEAAIASKGAARELNAIGGSHGIKTLTDSIAHRMTKAKFAQMVPVAGALVGGGFNAWLTQQTCDAACHLYRSRFLARRFAG